MFVILCNKKLYFHVDYIFSFTFSNFGMQANKASAFCYFRILMVNINKECFYHFMKFSSGSDRFFKITQYFISQKRRKTNLLNHLANFLMVKYKKLYKSCVFYTFHQSVASFRLVPPKQS